MATIEEVRSKLKERLGKFKVQTPTRVAYLGDGRGNATSNMVPIGEPNKFWARESLGGDKPFKITNKNPNLTPAFNLPVLLGYPEHDPETEQVLGLHSALIKLDAGGNVSGSSIGGTSPHHQKHEWGGGDTVYVDPRMFKPGLVVPTTPVSMRVKVLAFQHYYNFWRRYDGGVSPDLSQYIPDSDYRYVMLCLDPDTNQLVVHPGSVFTPDLSIDSIISNQATNTFRHIPVPPGNEIPLGVVLLEPDTTKVDWNPEGVNNLMPMRILLSSPMKEVNERLSLIESTTGISSLPQTGAANSVENDLLPGRIDGNRTRLVLNRSSASGNLPTLFVGELGYANDSPSGLVMGTASGNKLIPFGSGGGGASVLNELTDVNLTDLTGWRTLQYDPDVSEWIGAQTLSSVEAAIGEFGGVFVSKGYGVEIFTDSTSPVTFYTYNIRGLRFGGADGTLDDIEFNPNLDPDLRTIHYNSIGVSVEHDNANNYIRYATGNSPSALVIDHAKRHIRFNNENGASPMLFIDTAANLTIFGSATSLASFFEYHSPSSVSNGTQYHFNHATPAANNALGNQFYFKNSAGTMVHYGQFAFSSITGTAGVENGLFNISLASAGTLRTIMDLDTRDGRGVVFNNLGRELPFRIESSANSYQFSIDPFVGATQIGTSVAGQIADFRDHLIEFNKNQNDIDVVFKSKNDAYNLFLDAGTNRVGIGASSPQNKLHIVGSGAVAYLQGTASGDTNVVGFGFYDTGGVRRGFIGDAATGDDDIYIIADTGNLKLYSNGAVRATLFSGLQIGSPTGGDKGAGTINAQAVYDDNVLLTCYPIEYARTGSINLVEMDSKYGRGNKHTRAHDFSKKARKLVNIKEYSNEWKTKGHLPLFPSREEWESRQQIPVGEMTQSLAETVELQAIHIDNLQQQIDELKSIVVELRKK